MTLAKSPLSEHFSLPHDVSLNLLTGKTSKVWPLINVCDPDFGTFTFPILPLQGTKKERKSGPFA